MRRPSHHCTFLSDSILAIRGAHLLPRLSLSRTRILRHRLTRRKSGVLLNRTGVASSHVAPTRFTTRSSMIRLRPRLSQWVTEFHRSLAPGWRTSLCTGRYIGRSIILIIVPASRRLLYGCSLRFPIFVSPCSSTRIGGRVSNRRSIWVWHTRWIRSETRNIVVYVRFVVHLLLGTSTLIL